MESTEKVMEKCNIDNQRESLFTKLNDVITIAHEKVTAKRGNADSSKQGWIRGLISAISTYGNLLKDSEIDDLTRDVEEIKRELQKKHER